jgi:hypothetical protein
MPRDLRTEDAMERHWTDVASIYVTLLVQPLTKHLAPAWLARLDAVEACWAAQRACWREEYVGEALVAFANLALDGATEEFSADKLNELRKKAKLGDSDARKHPEYKLYFRNRRASELIKMALEAQLGEMSDWPAKVAHETAPELLAFKARFDALFDQGRTALTKRTDAAAATALHRAKDIAALVADLNKARRALATELEQIALANDLPKTWRDTFFRTAPQPTPDRAEARGKALAILGVLEARKLPVTDEQSRTILATTAPDVLAGWIAGVATTPSAAALLGA